MPAPQKDFAERLLRWFAENGRHELPWQKDRDPYKVWVSEIMLQQTQVTTVVPYFLRFIEEFPTIDALAAAPSDRVMHFWSGLGYYARARNLHRAAQIIVAEHGGRFPQSLEAVVELPGIGRSTAGAILAFCFDQHLPILDGNVKRVLTRCFAVPGFPGKAEVQRNLWELATSLTPAAGVADYTQGIMDLGATVCTRTKPACEICPMAQICIAYAEGNPVAYPHRKQRKPRPVRQITMLLVQNERHHILLEKRPPTGIWGGLWSLPELQPDRTDSFLADYPLVFDLKDAAVLPSIKHGFTHFDLEIYPRHIRVESEPDMIMDVERYLWYNLSSPQSIGLPAVISRLLQLL